MGKKKTKTKRKEKSSNVSGKPKHSFDTNRANGKKKSTKGRTAATVRRLQMYNTKPKRSTKGKILSNAYQSKELPNNQIQPDPRWFGNTRVVGQKELEWFRNEMSNNYNVILTDDKKV